MKIMSVAKRCRKCIQQTEQKISLENTKSLMSFLIGVSYFPHEAKAMLGLCCF